MVPFRVALDRLTSDLDGPGGRSPLTPREDDVAALVARGLSNRQIAAELYIAERTAQTHVQHILNRLNLRSRTQIAVWASDALRRTDRQEIRMPGQ